MKTSIKAILLATVSAASLMAAVPALAEDGTVTSVTIDTGNTLGLPAGTYDNNALGIHAGVTLNEGVLVKGDKGDQGEKGDTGAQGIQGVAGANGTNGVDGAQGPKGDKGDQGIQGNQGNQGFAGANGTNGTDGAKGDKGDQGVAGLNGADGAKGDKGDKGTFDPTQSATFTTGEEGKPSTTVGDTGITYQDGKGGKIEIGGDPTITVSGGGTQTQIVNGATTASGVAGSTYGFAAAGNANTGGGYVAAGVSGSQMGFVVANSGGYATLGASGSDAPSLAVSDGTRTTVLAKDGMSTTNGTHTTTVTANGVTTTGTVSAAVVSAGVLSTTGYSDVGSTLTSYDTRISANAAGISSLGALYSAQQGQINNLNGRMDKAYAGIAMATAFESPQVDPGKHFGIALNWGEFEGVSAFSTMGKFRFNDNWSATAGGAVSQGGQFSAKAGIQTQW
jgi:hypothetical protein